MSLRKYFESVEGMGVFGTADEKGNVDMAIYARPHFVDDETVAFLMADSLSRANVMVNGKAAYLFMEKGQGYEGRRLYLTMTGEDRDQEKVDQMRRAGHQCSNNSQSIIVYFRIESERPLVGGEKTNT